MSKEIIQLVIGVEKRKDPSNYMTFYFETKDKKDEFKKEVLRLNKKVKFNDEVNSKDFGYSVSLSQDQYTQFPSPAFNNFLKQIPEQTFLVACEGESILEKIQRSLMEGLKSINYTDNKWADNNIHSDNIMERHEHLFIIGKLLSKEEVIFSFKDNRAINKFRNLFGLEQNLSVVTSERGRYGDGTAKEILDVLPTQIQEKFKNITKKEHLLPSALLSPEKSPRKIGVTNARTDSEVFRKTMEIVERVKGSKKPKKWSDRLWELSLMNEAKCALEKGGRQNELYKALALKGKEFITQLQGCLNNNVKLVETLSEDIKYFNSSESDIIVPTGASEKAKPFIEEVAKKQPANEIDFTIQLLLAYVDASVFHYSHSEKGTVEAILKDFLKEKEDEQTFEKLKKIIETYKGSANTAGTFHGLCDFITSDAFILQWDKRKKTGLEEWSSLKDPNKARNELSTYYDGFFTWRHHKDAVRNARIALTSPNPNLANAKSILSKEAKTEDLNVTGHFARLYYTLRFGR